MDITGKTVLVSGVAADNEIIKSEDVTYGFDAGLSNLAVALRVFAGATEDENFIVGGEVSSSSGMTVSIAPIFAELYSTNQCVVKTSATSVTLDDADSSGDRVDVISVCPVEEGTQSETRVMNDPISGGKTYEAMDVRKAISLGVLVTKGTAGNVSASSAPSGYVKIAEVYVAAGASEITDDVIYSVTARSAGEDNTGWTADAAATYSIAPQAAAFVAFLEEHNEDGSHGDKVIKASNINFGVGKNAVKASVIPVGKSEQVRGTTYAATAPVTAIVEALAEHVDALYPWANDLLGRYTVASVSASYATTGAITLSSAQSIDGGAVTDGAVVLVKDQDDATENGLYVVSSSGEWSRHTSFASGTSAFDGVVVLVTKGSTNGGKGFYTSGEAVVGEDELVFSEVTLAAARLAVDSVGSDVKHVYFDGGVPVAASKTVGDTDTPVYVATGTITACTGVATSAEVTEEADARTAADDALDARVSTIEGGTIGSVDLGSATTPVYLDEGVISTCSQLATASDVSALSERVDTLEALDTGGAAYHTGVGAFNVPVYFDEDGYAQAGLGSVSTSTFIGIDAGASNTGSYNVGVGYQALYNNTNGGNVGVGYQVLYSNTTGGNNIALGMNALCSNTTGSYNTALGCQALYYNTTGSQNIALGYWAGYNNTTGGNNIALGRLALYFNTYTDDDGNTVSSSNNVALGYYAMSGRSDSGTTASSYGGGNIALGCETGRFMTGSNNIALGNYALRGSIGNTTGSYNIAIGQWAANGITTASYNIALGYYAGYKGTTGEGNVAIGYQALYTNTTGTHNTAVGYAAGYNQGVSSSWGNYNTFLGAYAGYGYGGTSYRYGCTAVGYQALYTANTTASGGYDNTALGYYALYSNTTGIYNTALGRSAGYNITTGYYNTALGNNALYANTTGGYNTALGCQALYNNTTGYYNTALGYGAGYNITTGYYNIAIGWSPTTSGSVSYITVPDATASYQYAIGPLKGRHFAAGSTLGQLYTWLYAYLPTSGDRATAIGTFYDASAQVSYRVNAVYNNAGTLTVYYGTSYTNSYSITCSSSSDSDYIYGSANTTTSSSSVLTLFIVMCAY